MFRTWLRLTAWLLIVVGAVIAVEVTLLSSLYPFLTEEAIVSLPRTGLRFLAVGLLLVVAIDLVGLPISWALARRLGGRRSSDEEAGARGAEERGGDGTSSIPSSSEVKVTVGVFGSIVGVLSIWGGFAAARNVYPTTDLPGQGVPISLYALVVVGVVVIAATAGWVASRIVRRTLSPAAAIAATAVLILGFSGFVVEDGVEHSSGRAHLATEAATDEEVDEGDRSAGEKGTGPHASQSVVLITVDTLRADHMSLYGYERSTTPGIDRWAEDAVVFDAAVTPKTFTGPALASLHTGLHPYLHGVRRHPSRLSSGNLTLAERFSETGYETAAFVTNPGIVPVGLGFGQGFDEWHGYTGERHRAENVLADAAAWVAARRLGEGGGGNGGGPGDEPRPYFLWIHLLDPHSPYLPPEPFDAAFVEDPLYHRLDGVEMRVVEDDPETGEVNPREPFGAGWEDLGPELVEDPDFVVAQYDGEIAYLDSVLAPVLEGIADAAPDAVVILTADHGESMVEHGYFFSHGQYVYEPTARIPLVVSHPEFPPGRVERLVSLVDVAPTLEELVPLPPAPISEGVSFADALASARTASERHVLLEAKSTASYPIVGIRSSRWKYVLTPRRATAPLDLLLSLQLGLSGKLGAGERDGLHPQLIRSYVGELYDLATDLAEENDLAGPERAARISRLRRVLGSFLWAQSAVRPLTGTREGEEGDRPEIDEETLEELRALGYLQ